MNNGKQIEHSPGTPVRATQSKHAGIAPGAEGMIVARHPTENGYAVEFEKVSRVAVMGGTFTEPAIVFLEPNEFRVDEAKLLALFNKPTIVDDTK